MERRKRETELATEAYRKAEEDDESGEEVVHYCRQDHGRERQEYFEIETIEEKWIRL